MPIKTIQCPVCYPPEPPVSTHHLADAITAANLATHERLVAAVTAAEEGGARLGLRLLAAYVAGLSGMPDDDYLSLLRRISALAPR